MRNAARSSSSRASSESGNGAGALPLATLLFCAAMQWLGLYVASFLLVAGFMRFIGRIAWWKSLLTSFVFAFAMFATFDVAFDVIMPKGPIEALFGR